MSRAPKLQTLHYRRSHFVTQLPVAYLYSPSHYWLNPHGPGRWRVGLTRFATRMLGRMVDHEFEAQDGQAIQPGDRIGWIEGFKAISDVYCAVAGSFAGGNRELREKISVIDKDPYAAGWLYEAEGKPDANCVDVAGYRVLLDKTIDRIMTKQSAPDES